MPKKGFYFSIVISMLAALLPLFLGWVLLQRLAALQDEAESFAAEATLLDFKQKNVKALKNVLEETGAQRSRVDALFIDAKGLVRFIQDLETAAKESGAVLKMNSAVLPESPEEKGPRLQFQISGSFPALFLFQTRLESSPYQIRFEKVDFLRAGEGAGQGAGWSADYSLKVLSYLF